VPDLEKMLSEKRRKYAADVEAEFSERPQPYGTYDQATEDRADAERGEGTEQSGYVTPELGPFRCDNCTHYLLAMGPPRREQRLTSEEGSGQGRCDHPIVLSDPEVSDGRVDADGCCNYFRSRHK
jgi:hypothetical protein